MNEPSGEIYSSLQKPTVVILNLSLKKGNAPLGLKLLETKCKQGVYINGFTEKFMRKKEMLAQQSSGSSSCQAIFSLAVGDKLSTIEGQDVKDEKLQFIKDIIEKIRRRDRLKTLLSSSARYKELGKVRNDDSEFSITFERLSCSYTLQEILLDPRKYPFFIKFLWEQAKDRNFIDQTSYYTLESEDSDRMESNSNDSISFSSIDSPFSIKSSFDVEKIGGSTHINLVRFLLDCNLLCELVELSEEKHSQPYFGSKLLNYFHPGSSLNLCSIFHEIEATTSNAVSAAAEISMSCTKDVLLAWKAITPLIQASETELDRYAFATFRESLWYKRMLAHLSGSATFIQISLSNLLYESTLRELFMLYLLQMEGGEYHWLKAWEVIELKVLPILNFFEENISRRDELAEFHKLQLLKSLVYLWDFYFSVEAHFSFSLPASPQVETALEMLSVFDDADVDICAISFKDAVSLGKAVQDIKPMIVLHIASNLIPKFRKCQIWESICAFIMPSFSTCGSTAPPNTFSDLWNCVDKENFYANISKQVPLSANISRHRPPCNSKSEHIQVDKVSISKLVAMDELKSLLSESLIIRKLGQSHFSRVTSRVPNEECHSLDWLLNFEGKVDINGTVSIDIVSSNILGNSSSDFSILSKIGPFLCPSLSVEVGRGPCYTKKMGNPKIYIFTMPTQDGTGKLYGSCLLMYKPYQNDGDTVTSVNKTAGSNHTALQYIPYGICALSKQSILPTLYDGLRQWFRSSVVSARDLNEIMNEVVLTNDLLAHFRTPEIHHQAAVLSLDTLLLFRKLNPNQICSIIMALLCEEQVILVSKHASFLTIAVESLVTMLKPLEWCHVCVPILPLVMARDFLQCPTPFVVGLLSDYVDELEIPADAVKVDLDNAQMYGIHFSEASNRAFSRVCAALKEMMFPTLEHIDNPFYDYEENVELQSELIFEAFQKCINSMLSGLWECCQILGTGWHKVAMFDKHMFKKLKMTQSQTLRKVEKKGIVESSFTKYAYQYDENFQNAFVETQMFSNYISSLADNQSGFSLK